MIADLSQDHRQGEVADEGADQAQKEMSLPELKQRLSQWQEDVFKLETRARKEWDPSTAAVFREVYFWSFQTKDPDQWLWKTYEKWWEDHGLTKAMVRTAVLKLLKAGVIDKKNGLGNRMYFRLMPARVIEVLYSDKDHSSTSGSEVSNQDFCGATSRHLTSSYDSSRKREEEKKKESEKAPAGASARTRRISSSKGTKNDVVDDKRHRGGGDAPRQKAAGENEDSKAAKCVNFLNERLPFDLTKGKHGQRSKYLEQAQRLIDQGVDGKEMKEVLERVVERWTADKPCAALPLELALQDVRARGTKTRKEEEAMRRRYPRHADLNEEKPWTEKDLRRYWSHFDDAARPERFRDGKPERKPSPDADEEITITAGDLDAALDGKNFDGKRTGETASAPRSGWDGRIGWSFAGTGEYVPSIKSDPAKQIVAETVAQLLQDREGKCGKTLARHLDGEAEIAEVKIGVGRAVMETLKPKNPAAFAFTIHRTVEGLAGQMRETRRRREAAAK